jgi:hypothetical protein
VVPLAIMTILLHDALQQLRFVHWQLGHQTN